MNLKPNRASGLVHGLRYLGSALGSNGLAADEPVLDLSAFLRALNLALELLVGTILRTRASSQDR